MSRPYSLRRAKALLRRVSHGHGATLVKERLIHLSTLSRGFRVAVFATYGFLAIVAVLISLHHKLANTDRVSVVGISIPTGVIAAAAPIFAIALVLILTGVMLANARLRYTIVALTALFLLPFGMMARVGVICCDPVEAQHARPSVLFLTLLFESMAVVLLAAALLARKLRASYVAGLCLLAVLLPFGTGWLVSARWHPGFGSTVMIITWAVFMFAILPALVLVGLDLVEWSMLFGGFTGDAVDPQIWAIIYLTRQN